MVLDKKTLKKIEDIVLDMLEKEDKKKRVSRLQVELEKDLKEYFEREGEQKPKTERKLIHKNSLDKIIENDNIDIIYKKCSNCGKPINSRTSQYCSKKCEREHLEDYYNRIKETEIHMKGVLERLGEEPSEKLEESEPEAQKECEVCMIEDGERKCKTVPCVSFVCPNCKSKIFGSEKPSICPKCGEKMP